PPEIRFRSEDGEIQIESPSESDNRWAGSSKAKNGNYGDFRGQAAASGTTSYDDNRPLKAKKIFPYGVGQNRLRQAARTLRLPITIVDDIDDADVLMTLKSYYRKHPQPIATAERLGKPVYVLRSNTVIQMESCLADIFALSAEDTDYISIARRETQDAIEKVLSGTRSIQLSPQTSDIRREQHQMVRQANLISHSSGREPHRRVRIYRDSPGRGK
ncbi:MAG: R3H domain-containing nucleic acid-binding protein, partial [Anaerolineae bacterium]|nr:R3H domain-containing nucleic acid-binding protein [Anaerolineae bacterium]